MKTSIHGLHLAAPYGREFPFKVHKGPFTLYQDYEEVENAQHLLSNCSRYRQQRRTLQLQLNQLDDLPVTLQNVLDTSLLQKSKHTIRCSIVRNDHPPNIVFYVALSMLNTIKTQYGPE